MGIYPLLHCSLLSAVAAEFCYCRVGCAPMSRDGGQGRLGHVLLQRLALWRASSCSDSVIQGCVGLGCSWTGAGRALAIGHHSSQVKVSQEQGGG